MEMCDSGRLLGAGSGPRRVGRADEPVGGPLAYGHVLDVSWLRPRQQSLHRWPRPRWRRRRRRGRGRAPRRTRSSRPTAAARAAGPTERAGGPAHGRAATSAVGSAWRERAMLWAGGCVFGVSEQAPRRPKRCRRGWSRPRRRLPRRRPRSRWRGGRGAGRAGRRRRAGRRTGASGVAASRGAT